jgi:ATP-dependent helicase/nuclease subunit B
LRADRPIEPNLERLTLPHARFLRSAARAVTERFGAQASDLSPATFLLPTRAAGAGFARALAESAEGPVLLLPRLTTLADWAASVPWGAALWTDTARELALFAQLRGRGWFDDSDLWGVAGELRRLADDLTRHRATLPGTVQAFTARLEEAYRHRAGAPMEMEARLVHEAWCALVRDAGESVDAATRYHLQLGALARSAHRPLVAVGLSMLSAAETEFLATYAARQPVLTIEAEVREGGAAGSLERVLHAAWPPAGGHPSSLRERAAAFRGDPDGSPLAGRLSLWGTASLEEEAQLADARVRAWLLEGRESIAVVVQDRLVARRLRALLERARVLVQDETGWPLSTVAAATAIMRFLDCLASDFHHRDLLDLLKSPFIFADWSADARRGAAYRLEQIARRESIASGLRNFDQAAGQADQAEHARNALARIRGAALRMFPRRSATVGAWLQRLREALDELGVLHGLAQDAAGQQLLDLLTRLGRELGDSGPRIRLAEWRRWLDGRLEGETFRDRDVTSPVIFTHLAATRLRELDAVILLGFDARQFPGAGSETVFFNQSVRRQLGLPVREDELEQVRRDLVALIASSAEVVVTWQSQVDGESNPVSAYFEMLQAFHQLAYDADLRAAIPSAGIRAAQVAGEPSGAAPWSPAGAPAPASADLVPLQVSVSAWASLIACPYQFFARHMLKLNELDEVQEAIEKKDHGESVHEILQRFHARHPRVWGADRGELERGLAAVSDEVFAPLVERDYLAVGWLLRWKSLIPGYLDWQAAREQAGWRFVAGEDKRALAIPLGGESVLTFQGRLDRLDQHETEAGTEYAVVDYKTQSVDKLRKKVSSAGEDVQLSGYALLQGQVSAAFYLSLDRDRVEAVASDGEPAHLAAAERERLARSFSRLLAGAALPAHGDEATCGWCEMRALCRRDYWA